jgi:hypothetical protein
VTAHLRGQPVGVATYESLFIPLLPSHFVTHCIMNLYFQTSYYMLCNARYIHVNKKSRSQLHVSRCTLSGTRELAPIAGGCGFISGKATLIGGDRGLDNSI